MNKVIMTALDTEKREITTLDKAKYYPFQETDKLCAYLDDHDFLFEIYSKVINRKEIKAFCKNINWRTKPDMPYSLSEELLKELLHSICSAAETRKKLEELDARYALPRVILKWLFCSKIPAYEKLKNFIFGSDIANSTTELENLLKILSEFPVHSQEEQRTASLIVLAIIMIQKKNKNQLIKILNEKFPNLFYSYESSTEELKEIATNVVSESENAAKIDSESIGIIPFVECIKVKAQFDKELLKWKRLESDFELALSELDMQKRCGDIRDGGVIESLIQALSKTRVSALERYQVLVKISEKFQHIIPSFSKNQLNSINDIDVALKDYNGSLNSKINTFSVLSAELEQLKIKEERLRLSAELGVSEYSLRGEYYTVEDISQELTRYKRFYEARQLEANYKAKEEYKKFHSLKNEVIKKYNDRNQEYSSSVLKIFDEISEESGFVDVREAIKCLNEITLEWKYKSPNAIKDEVENIQDTMNIPAESIVKICKILNIQKKQDVSVVLILIYQAFMSECDLSHCADEALDCLLDAICESDLPISEILNSESWLAIVSSDSIRSINVRERVIIFLIVSAFSGHSDFASTILIKLNAIEYGRTIFPKCTQDIVARIVGQQPVQFMSSEFQLERERRERSIKDYFSFSDGKYKRLQRNTKHFARFESKMVYPDLERIWNDFSPKLIAGGYKLVIERIKSINVDSWYEELSNVYDKPLTDHIHFSQVTKNVMESFLSEISSYAIFCEIEMSGEKFTVDVQQLRESFSQWQGGDKSRAAFLNNLFTKLRTGKLDHIGKTIWTPISTSQCVLLSCPNLLIFNRSQSVVVYGKELIEKILTDLSEAHSLGDVEDFYIKNRAYNLAAKLVSEINPSHSHMWLVEHQKEKEILDGKLEYVASINDRLAMASFQACLDEDRLVAANKILQRCDSLLEARQGKERAALQDSAQLLLLKIQEVKEAASDLTMSERWLETIYQYCGAVERRLRTLRRSEDLLAGLKLEESALKSAVNALKALVEIGSDNFDEVQYYLDLNRESPSTDSVPDIDSAREICPDLIKHWISLSSPEIGDDSDLKKRWLQFVKEFAKISKLYHDESDEQKRFGLSHGASQKYKFPVYQSAFYKPRSEFLKRQLRLYLYKAEIEGDPLRGLEQELFSEESAARLHIVFAPQGFDKIKRYFKYDKGFKNFLLVDDAFIFHLCSHNKNKHDVPLRQALHASVKDFASSSPFVSQGYCHETNNIYVGRKDILHRLTNNPQAMIWGGRRIGKTSVLHALEHTLKNRNYKTAYVYVDIPGKGDPDLAIARKIADNLGIGEVKNISDFGKKISKLRLSGTKVAFLIDEVDEYIKKSRAFNGKEFPLATVLRQLVMDDTSKDTILVYSGYHQLYFETKLDKEKRRVGHPFINIAQEIPIRDLSHDDVKELVLTGFEEMMGISVSPEVPRLIAERASRHPAFVQQFCRCLLDQVSRRRAPGAKITVTADDVEAVYNAVTTLEGREPAFILYVDETLGFNLSHLGRAIMLAINEVIAERKISSDAFFTTQFVLDHLITWCDLIHIPKPDEQHFRQTIELLMMTNMLTQHPDDPDHYRVTYPTHIDILSRLHKMGRTQIENSLQEYDLHERENGVLL